MENLNFFEEKHAEVGKCVIAISTEILESQYKTFLKFSKFLVISDFLQYLT